MNSSNINRRLAALSPGERALLLKQLQEMKQEERSPISESIERQKRSSLSFPLSFAQLRLWIIDQMEPGNAAYNVPQGLHILGQLNYEALKSAIIELIHRHEVLRTTFSLSDKQPEQVISAFSMPEIASMDLTNIQDNEEKKLRTLDNIHNTIQRPFDLAQGSLLRVLILRLNEQEHILILTLHHIISDGWSVGIFIRELAALYDTFANQQANQLPPLPIQYADYAVWQRKWLQGEQLEKLMVYWRNQLMGVPALLELPTDRPRPLIQSLQGAQYSFIIPPTLSNALAAISRKEKVTLFMTLLAAFKVLLMRYSGQDDVVVGTPIANRTRSEVEGLIGFFVNMLPLRTDLSGNPSFRALLHRVRQTCLGAYTHQDLPFEKLVDEMQPVRDPSHTPLFQVAFALQNAPMSTFEVTGATLKKLELETKTAKFDLTLFLEEDSQGLQGAIEYNTYLFDISTIKRMSDNLLHLLANIVTNYEQSIWYFTLSGVLEQQKMLIGCKGDEIIYNNRLCMHILVEEQVKRTPQSIAIKYQDCCMTYDTLNGSANTLAYQLRMAGVRPEVRVAICVERSLEMIIGFLGILKAGGVCVPLDPAYPQERLKFMIEDAQTTILVTQRHLIEQLPVREESVFYLDGIQNKDNYSDQPDLENGVVEQNAAYVIYTSGSTGKPKGVLISHQSLCNRLLWGQQTFALSGTDSVLQKASTSFDFAIWECFGPLIAGAQVVIIAPGEHKDAAFLVEQIVKHQITVTHFIPSLLRVVLDETAIDKCTSLKHVFGGAEPLPASLQNQFLARNSSELHNVYGATETAIDATCWTCRYGDERPMVPIGYPIANMQLYLLDPYLNLAPIGVIGEIYIGGAGLARGYLHQPALTAQRFIPNPFSSTPGTRLYRTGDIARYLSDGDLEFLGRADQQIKLRGFRIELGEIETILAQHPTVQEAVVLIYKGNTSDDQRLIAYLTLNNQDQHKVITLENEASQLMQEHLETQVNPHNPIVEVRRYAKDHLPEYMVPGVFMTLDKFPLTPSGKVDRRALPLPDKSRPQLAANYAPPQTPGAKLLAEIWAQVIGVDKVGIYDNFFELGGDSLQVIRMVSQANQVGLRITAKQVFKHQTIADLDSALDTTYIIAEQDIVVGPIPSMPAQQHFFESNALNPQLYNISVLLEAHDQLNAAIVEEVIRYILLYHDALRLRVVQDNVDSPLFIDSPADAVPFIYMDLLGLSDEAQQQKVEKTITEIQTSFDLALGPLIKVILFDYGQQKTSRLLVSIHYLPADVMSWQILLNDFQSAYQQLSSGKAIQFPPKMTSVKQWAERLMEYTQMADIKNELLYWTAASRLTRALLPLDYPEGANVIGSTRIHLVEMTFQETLEIQRLAQVCDTHVQTVLLTALNRAYVQWAGNGGVLIDIPNHGRKSPFDDMDISRTVGWLNVFYPFLLRNDLENPYEDVYEDIKEIKRQLEEIPHEGFGYGILKYFSTDKEITQRMREIPPAELYFNYVGPLYTELPLFKAVTHFGGHIHNEAAPRPYLLTIRVVLSDEGKLQLYWDYSCNLHKDTTIELLAARTKEILKHMLNA